MILEKSMGNPFVWKVVVLSWGKLDALLLDTWKISRCQNQNGCQTQTITTHLLIKKRFCRLLLSYEIHWITCAVRHRMTDDQDQHKHTLSFLKSVLSFSKPQLSFQKIETPRILLSIAVNFGCSCSSYTYYIYIYVCPFDLVFSMSRPERNKWLRTCPKYIRINAQESPQHGPAWWLQKSNATMASVVAICCRPSHFWRPWAVPPWHDNEYGAQT